MDSEASLAGTLQHSAAESRDLSVLEEQEQVEAVQRCIALEDREIGALVDAGFSVTVIREHALVVCPGEKVVDEHGDTWDGLSSGFPDTLIIARKDEGSLAVLLDWKFGKMFVTPTKDNLQGKTYALAVYQKYAVEEIKVTFYHPHLEKDAPLPEYTHVFQREDMPQIELEIRLVIARKRRAKREGWNSEIRPVPCTNLCVWCANLDECPGVLSLATQTQAKSQQLAVPDEVRPAYLSRPEDAKKVYQLSKVLETFSKAVRKRITDMVLTEGLEIEGMKIVTKSDREITSISAVRDVAVEAGVTQEQFESCLSLPITKVEDMVKKLAPRGKGAAKVREFQQGLEDVGAVKKGKPYSYLVEAKEDAIDV